MVATICTLFSGAKLSGESMCRCPCLACIGFSDAIVSVCDKISCGKKRGCAIREFIKDPELKNLVWLVCASFVFAVLFVFADVQEVALHSCSDFKSEWHDATATQRFTRDSFDCTLRVMNLSASIIILFCALLAVAALFHYRNLSGDVNAYMDELRRIPHDCVAEQAV
eukprot:m.141675 g.141675  ORF g.141675 m.141675 type:complete len:168 (-) comp10024_c0_seq3:1211-1714(-)